MISNISPYRPADFGEQIKGYLATIRLKKSEHDKRAYMKSKLMEDIFKIKPEFIDYEKDRIDLYYAGVLIETKTIVNDANRQKAFVEVKDYLERSVHPLPPCCIPVSLLQLFDLQSSVLILSIG